MHITMLALGSYGDVLPLAYLGEGLTAVGHQVRLVTFENFKEMASSHGLDFHPIQGDAQSILNTGGGQALAESGQNVIRAWWAAMHSFGTLAQSYADDLSAPELRETDLIINQLPGAMYGYDLAEQRKLPMMIAAVMPLARTNTFPMLAFPTQLSRLPGYNALTYRLVEQLMWQWFRPTINRWRQETLRLPKQSFWGYFKELGTARFPILNGFSSHLIPRPADWNSHIHLTGYWFPEETNWQPSDDLQKFIDKSPPPVFIGFGSMPVRNPARTTRIILDALKQSGLRAVLHAGWAGIGNQDLPNNVFKIEYAPYGWLFPRMSAVVHHGGSGTTAFGLRAGVPSLIIPFLFDQFFWGKRILGLGVGPAPIPHKKLTSDRLAGALTLATTDTTMAKRAAVLGEKIRSEDGIKKAEQIINDYV